MRLSGVSDWWSFANYLAVSRKGLWMIVMRRAIGSGVDEIVVYRVMGPVVHIFWRRRIFPGVGSHISGFINLHFSNLSFPSGLFPFLDWSTLDCFVESCPALCVGTVEVTARSSPR